MAASFHGSNLIDGNNMQALVSFQNRPGSIPLNYVIDCAIQKVYADVQHLVDLFPGKTDMEKKMDIAVVLSRSRYLFIRLLALVKWANSASKVDKCEKISNFLDEQSMFLLETANVLSRMTRETLVGARLPPFGVVLATDVLTKKTYTRLPACIKKKYISSGAITKWQHLETLVELNKLIQYRLSTIVLPLQMRNVKIKNGRAIFSVLNEFRVSLTLMSDVLDFPWRILSVKILVSDPIIGKGRPLVHSLQTKFLLQQLQARVLVKSLEKRNPIFHIYEMLHRPKLPPTDSFCISLQLELLHDQALRLIRLQPVDVVTLANYHVGSQLTLAYWRQLAEPIDGRPVRCYSVCIHIDTLDPYQPLRVTHSPDLPLKDQLSIVSAIRTEFPSLELLITRTMAVRSRKLLEDLRLDLLSLCPGPVVLQDAPLLLQLPLAYPCLTHELVHLQVLPHRGLVQARLAPPSAQHGPEAAAYLDQLSSAVNQESGKRSGLMAEALAGLRLWLGLTRVQRSLKPLAVMTTLSLPLVMSADGHPVAEIVQAARQSRSPLLFVKLLKTNEYYLLVQPACRGLELTYHFALLTGQPCAHDGSLILMRGDSAASSSPQSQRFLRPTSYRRLDVTRMLTANLGETTDDIAGHLGQIRSSRATRKRSAVACMLSLVSSAISSALPSQPGKRPRLEDGVDAPESGVLGTVPMLPQLLALAEESIMMTALVEQLDRAGIQHNGIELIGAKSVPAIHIQRFPDKSASELWSAGERSLSQHRRFIASYTVLAQRRNQRCWQVEVVLLPWLATRGEAGQSPRRRRICSTHLMLRLEDAGELVKAMFHEWSSLCALHTLSLDLGSADNLPPGVIINEFTSLHSLTISYGPDQCYMATVIRERGLSNERGFQLVLCTAHTPTNSSLPVINPHLVIQEHLHKLINRTHSLRCLVEELIQTLDFMIALDPLRDTTLVYHTVLNTGSSLLTKNISLTAASSHHILVNYRGTFTLHLSLHPSFATVTTTSSDNEVGAAAAGSLVFLEDACGTPLAASTPACQPIPQFKEFLEEMRTYFNMDQNTPAGGFTVAQLSALCQQQHDPATTEPVDQGRTSSSPLVSLLSMGLLLHTGQTALAIDPSLDGIRVPPPQAAAPASSAPVVLELASTAAQHEVRVLSEERGDLLPPLWRLRLHSRPSKDGWNPDKLQVLDQYFNSMISDQDLVLPSALISFLRLLTLPVRALRELCHCMSWELLGLALPSPPHRVRLSLVGMLPSLPPSLHCQLGQPAVVLKENGLCYLQVGVAHSESSPSAVFYLILSFDAANNTVTQVLPVSPPFWSPQQVLVSQNIKASTAETTANGMAKQDAGETSPLLHYFNYLAQQTQLW